MIKGRRKSDFRLHLTKYSMGAYDIAGLTDQERRMKNKLRAYTVVPDRRGPLVYNLTQVASLNGVEPETLSGVPEGFTAQPDPGTEN